MRSEIGMTVWDDPRHDRHRGIDVIRPDASNKAVYDELYAVYRKLHPATVEFQHTLAEMQLR